METNPWTKSELFAWNDGRRIVDLHELSKQLHCKQCRSLLDLQRTEREARYGFASVLYIHCNCGLMNDVHTSRIQQDHEDGEEKSGRIAYASTTNPVFEINTKASINVLMYDGGSSSLVLQFLALLDIPVPAPDDASLIVPITDNANLLHTPSALPSTADTTSVMESGSTQTSRVVSRTGLSVQKSLSSSLLFSESDPLVSSAPEAFPSVSGSDDGNAASNDRRYSVADVLYHPENQALDYNVSDDEDVNDDAGGDDDDDYIPPAKLKLRLKPTPKPAPKRRTSSRRPKNMRAKSAAKKVTPERKVKTLTIRVKDVLTESTVKASEGEEEGEEDVKEEKGRESTSIDFDNPMEWSSTESEGKPARGKERDGSQREEVPEQESKVELEKKPKRKRGRPRGSTDRAKRAKRSESRMAKKSQLGETQDAGSEAKDVPSCTVCMKGFNSIKGYNVHMKRVHNQDMKEIVDPAIYYYLCSPCQQPAVYNYSIVVHLESRQWADWDPEGPGAGKRGRGDSAGTEVEPPADPKPEPVSTEIYVCTYCQQPFARDYTVLSHIRHKHWSPNMKPQESYVTMQLGSIIHKMPTRKAKVHGLFCCRLCGASLSREPMAGHIVVSPDGGLACAATCPQGKKLLYLEMNYVFTDKQGYLCDTCGEVFKVPVHLDTHLLKVHGVMTERHRRCQCPICGTTFSLPSHVKKHMAHKHPNNNDSSSSSSNATAKGRRTTFMCDLCGKEYDRLDSMMVHKRRHHTEGKRFQCEHCPKKFFGRSHWLTHMRKHFNVSQHACPWCGDQFSSSYALKVHQRRHTGEKPYHCKLCDAKFAQKTSLTVHMRKHQKMDAGKSGADEPTSTAALKTQPPSDGAGKGAVVGVEPFSTAALKSYHSSAGVREPCNDNTTRTTTSLSASHAAVEHSAALKSHSSAGMREPCNDNTTRTTTSLSASHAAVEACTAQRAESGSAGLRGAKTFSRPHSSNVDQSDSAADPAGGERARMSRLEEPDSVAHDKADSVSRQGSSAVATPPETLSKQGDSGSADPTLIGVLDRSKSTTDAAAAGRRERVSYGSSRVSNHTAVERQLDPPMGSGFKGRAPHRTMGTLHPSSSPPLPPPPPPQTDGVDHSMMEMIDPTSARLGHPRTPLLPPPPAPPADRDLSPGQRRQGLMVEGLIPPGYHHPDKRLDLINRLPGYERPDLSRGEEETAWTSQGFAPHPQSDLVDGGRVGHAPPHSAVRSVQDDPGSTDPRLDPPATGQLYGGTGQIVFPSFSYPGTSFYY